jgi:hypothetical protein
MALPHPLRSLGLLLLIVAATFTRVSAQSFTLATRPLVIPENGEFTQLVIITSTNEFLFLPPAGWKLGIDTNQTQLTWLAPDFASSITLKIVPRNEGKPPAREQMRQTILEAFSGAKIVDEPACYTGSGPGQAFDLEYPGGKDFKQASRLAYLPFHDGIVEFALTTSAEKFPKRQYDLNLLLNSFHIEPRGPSR